ncbi:SRPBCC domain-containing protein [Virgibacillus sp. LDC-1]|uniref:SRPBCC domain-containing protein n=1 Tax=Virgibacillus sp. LDC-1 TaxID=3039856 RepID=UPI0024DE2A42|nr:SRPBCC domain-containing protein [Virgibacillus sp. LDC-1]
MDTQVTTEIKILSPAPEVFEAFVDPDKIGGFWFSSSSERWEQGKTITIRYDEFETEGLIKVLEVEKNRKIVFSWGFEENDERDVTISLKELDNTSTIIEVIESGFKEEDPQIVDKMIGQKGGWVYALTCLKGYLENGATNLRASILK